MKMASSITQTLKRLQISFVNQILSQLRTQEIGPSKPQTHAPCIVTSTMWLLLSVWMGSGQATQSGDFGVMMNQLIPRRFNSIFYNPPRPCFENREKYEMKRSIVMFLLCVTFFI